MKFCISKAVITPDIPVFLQGFMGRSHKSEGVHDDIYAKVILLQANKPIMIIALDICYADRVFCKEIKADLSEKYAIKEDEILINFTHTHSAIAVNGNVPDKKRSGYSIAQDTWGADNKDYSQDIRYTSMLKEKIMKLAEYCFENLEEGSLLLGKGASHIGVNRRLMTPEGIKMLPNFDAEYDTDLFVLKLVDVDSNVKGVIFSYGCHPTTMSFDNYLLSAEWCGFACKHLEKEFAGATAVFLQACAGDVKPKASAAEGKFKGCSFEETEKVGSEIAEDVISIIRENKVNTIDLNIKTCIKEIRLYSQIDSVSELEKRIADPLTHESTKKSLRKVMESIKSGDVKQSIPLLISVWYFDDNFKIIGLEGEILNTIGRRIKDIYKDNKTIVLGYSNGIQGYIPNREALEEGGYERDSYLGRGLCGPYIPEIENIIYGNIVTAFPK